MPKRYWLLKTEPEAYSVDDLKRDKKTCWDGVRNYQARNNLQAMANGDAVLFYHSGDQRCVVGTATVTKTAYQDPTTDEAAWVVVDLKAGKRLKRPVSLTEIKAHPAMTNIGLVKQGRLSVIALTEAEYSLVVALGS